MAQDVEVKQENLCCIAWKKKCYELKQKNLLHKEFKQEFLRYKSNVDGTIRTLENDKLTLKKDNEILQQALQDLETRWKNEKEMGSGIRVDLENEVSDLKDEIRELKEKASGEADKKRLDVVEEEIKRMMVLLEKEKERADSEKKKGEDALKRVEKEKSRASEAHRVAGVDRIKAEENVVLLEKLKKEIAVLNSEKKKGEDALKKVEKEKSKASEAQRVANVERKKAEENVVLLEKLKKEIDLLNSEKKKGDDALKKVEKEKSRASEAHRVANVERKKAEENAVLLEKLKKEINVLNSALDLERSKSEVAGKKLEAEEKKAISERKRADLANAKAKEQRKLAETNMKKAEEYKLLWEKTKIEVNNVKAKSDAEDKKLEAEKQKTRSMKDETDDLKRKLEEEKSKVKKLEKELHQQICAPNTGNIVEPTCTGMVINEHTASHWDKVLFEKDQNIIREKSRADSETKKATKYEKDAKEHNKMAIEQKHRADSLLRELESYKLRLKELGNEPHEHLPYRRNSADVSRRVNNNFIYENERVKLLEKELKIEKMRVKHAKEAKNLEVRRNHMLHQELLLLKQELLQFRPLDMLGDSFQNDGEGILEHEKMSEQTFTRGEFYRDQSHGQLTSGTDSILNHPCRGSKRNILQNSAINSSSASISDQTLMGSAKVGEVSCLEPTVSNLFVKKRMRSPIRGNSNESTVGHNDVRFILDACASVENTHLKGHKLHHEASEKITQLHGLLNDKQGEPTAESLQDDSGKHVGPFKRRKTSCNGAIVIHSLHESRNPVLYSVDGDACAPVTNQHILLSNQNIAAEGDGLAIDDYMKLLDLDNPVDEESYRRAIALPVSPLSPTLHDIAFYGEKEPTNLVLNDVVTSQFQRWDDSVTLVQNTGVLQAGHAHFHQIENDEMNKSCEKSVFLKYYVISSQNIDGNSILRILQTIRSCTPQCSILDTPDIFLQNLLKHLIAEDISMKEKVCAFFCIVLHTVSESGTGDLVNALSSDFIQLLASITRPICSALFDLALRKLFMESCDLNELLALVEDFIKQRKVMVCAEASAKMNTLQKPKLNLDLNGNAISVYQQSASARQLVVASSLFASICSGVDQIRFVCEVSCHIFSKDKFDPATSLAVLHAFTHTCGSQYFTLHDYALAMTVVKSLVMHLENQSELTNATPKYEVWSCSADCPFSEGALVVKDVASLLVNKLQVYVRSVSWFQDSNKGHNHRDSAPTDVVQLSNAPDEKLFNFMDIVSLVEILASFMGWEWTNVNFVVQVGELLESCLSEDSSAAIGILLGQFGRLGVAANGYESIGVEELRERLSAFLLESNFPKLSLVTQFSLMTALLGVTPINFEELVQSKDDTALALSKSVDANFVKKWFSHLSSEQQSVFQSLVC